MSHLSTTHQPISKTGIWHDCDFYLHSVVLEAAKGNLMLIPPSLKGRTQSNQFLLYAASPVSYKKSIYVQTLLLN